MTKWNESTVWASGLQVCPLHQLSKQKAAKAWIANFIPSRNISKLPAKKQNHQIRCIVFMVVLLTQDLIQWSPYFNTLALAYSDIQPLSDEWQC